MTRAKPSEGEIPFYVPQAGKPCHTWYKIVGELKGDASKIPLITLHGGPGACHELLGSLADLNEQCGIPVVFYDQIGNGKSTHLRGKAGDESFWVEDLFIRELDNLIEYLGLRTGFDLYGQSWGGMLASRYATLHPVGLRKLIIANAPASVKLVLKGEEALRAALPKDVRETLEKCEREGRTDSEEYESALQVYRKRHICRIEPFPEELRIAARHMKEDPTVSKTMWGGDKLKPTGNLKDWTIMEDIPKIEADTLILNGRYDQVQDIAVIPFFERLPRVRWVTLENSSHLGFLEERERCMKLMGGFLAGFQS
ncbi:MAG: hypothetical protein M1820_002168 [Bogoriella megaspora]|nr:MAG: hypothetical protein M1820_002168 [Bogoriella megaspora]